MPDLHTQLRDYARFAVDEVAPVTVHEAVERAPVQGPVAAPLARRVRVMAAITAIAAAVAGGVVWLQPGDEGVRVAVKPPAPPTTATALTAVPGETRTISAPLRFPGLAGTRRHGNGETSIKLVTLSGESFWLTLPDDAPGLEGLQVVAGAVFNVTGSVGAPAWLTTLTGPEVADRFCWPPGTQPPCPNVSIRTQRRAANGALVTVWDVKVEPLVTVEMGTWTLALSVDDVAAMERTADALVWSVDSEGYLRLRSDDAGVKLAYPNIEVGDPEAGGLRLTVMAGCGADPELGWPAARPELKLEPLYSERVVAGYAGLWCAGGKYRVDVISGDPALVTRLHERLRLD